MAPRGSATRPTSDRVKEALFSILGPPVPRTGTPFRVLDLFAGSGALGLEAVSRGADEVVLVDEDEAAVAAAGRNVGDLGLALCVRVIRSEVGRLLQGRGPAIGIFDWIFVDPPYVGGALDRALRLLSASTVIAPGGWVIAEHARHSEPADRIGRLVRDNCRSWGDTAMSFYRIAEE